MKKSTPSCERMGLVCRWHGKFRNCSELFKMKKTDDGFCCSFNTRSVSESFAWNPNEMDTSKHYMNNSAGDEYGTEYEYEYGSEYDYAETEDYGSDDSSVASWWDLETGSGDYSYEENGSGDYTGDDGMDYDYGV